MSERQPPAEAPGAAPVNALWGGRFAAGPAAVLARINASIGFDRRLAAQDIAGSRAHARMLAHAGILSADDAAAIERGLAVIEDEVATGTFPFVDAHEDIHLNIEMRLRDLIGPAAGRLHTARSRNDQVATDFRLWVREALEGLDRDLGALQAALLDRADSEAATILPGLTHLQPAQPVTLGFHLLAYVEMFGRDRGRARDARARLNECPLGAAALAGTSFPIDRHETARALGFDAPCTNAMDAVSARDFALEFLAVASIAATHLSRLADEIVLWTSPLLGYARLSDRWSTGSSIMPQKRNPDAAELVRGKAGRVFGALVALLTTVKGLPLAYSKDLQEDKEPVFDAADTLALGCAALTGMVADLTFDRRALRAAAAKGYLEATDLADWLVQRLGLPFREAHHATGRLVAQASLRGVPLCDLTMGEMHEVEPRITHDIYDVLSVEACVARRTSFGGTAPVRVREAVAAARARHLGGRPSGPGGA